MDKTIQYTNTIEFKHKEQPKETTKDDYLQILENQYGKDFNGEGFAFEKYEIKNDSKPQIL